MFIVVFFLCLSCVSSMQIWNDTSVTVKANTVEVLFNIPPRSVIFYWAIRVIDNGNFEFDVYANGMDNPQWKVRADEERFFTGYTNDLDPNIIYQFRVRVAADPLHIRQTYFAAQSTYGNWWMIRDKWPMLPNITTQLGYQWFPLPYTCQNVSWYMDTETDVHVTVERYKDTTHSQTWILNGGEDPQTQGQHLGQDYAAGFNGGFYLFKPFLIGTDYAMVKNKNPGGYQFPILNFTCFMFPQPPTHGGGGGGTNPGKHWGKAAQNGFSIAITVLIGICVFCCCYIVCLFCLASIGMGIAFGARKAMGFDDVSDAFDATYQ